MADEREDRYPFRFGRFRVIGPLVQGGMGMVYLAEDDTGRGAVVKTIRADLAADPSYRARFRSEAQAALRFRSNLVARVWDCDANADPPWIALEKIEGPTLREVVMAGRVMDNAALLAFAADLAEGVHAFYDQGMAHGDLTPSNVVIQDGNRVKILDLGLTRPTADETATGDLPAMGTPYWLAPEVAAGFAPDNLSDVNQWGKLVLYAGTGYPHGQRENLRDALVQLTQQLRTLVEECLSAVPDARPSAEELWNKTRQRRLSGRTLPSLDLTSRRLAVDPGGDGETTAMVTNRGAVSGTYFFEMLGPLKEWASINPSRATIAPGAEASVRVGFRIPTASRVAPGEWPFGVRCSSEGDMSQSAVIEGSVAIACVRTVRLDPLAQSPRGRWSGRYAVSVRNDGNSPIRVRLTAVGVGDDLSFAISPSILDLRPAQSELGLVRVRARRPSLLGPPVARDFRVVASLEDDGQPPGRGPDTVCLSASFEQVRVLSRR
jgi:serine/threonine protein kinase